MTTSKFSCNIKQALVLIKYLEVRIQIPFDGAIFQGNALILHSGFVSVDGNPVLVEALFAHNNLLQEKNEAQHEIFRLKKYLSLDLRTALSRPGSCSLTQKLRIRIPSPFSIAHPCSSNR